MKVRALSLLSFFMLKSKLLTLIFLLHRDFTIIWIDAKRKKWFVESFTLLQPRIYVGRGMHESQFALLKWVWWRTRTISHPNYVQFNPFPFFFGCWLRFILLFWFPLQFAGIHFSGYYFWLSSLQLAILSRYVIPF